MYNQIYSKRTAIALAVLPIICAMFSPLIEARADGHFQMVWSYSQFNDESNKGRSTSLLIVGIPETDNLRATASCFGGSTAGLPKLEVFANTQGYRPGDAANVEFNTDVGPVTYQGSIRQPASEEDYFGVTINLMPDDPLWQTLMRMNEVSFRFEGQTYILPLKGSRRAITRFLEDCLFLHPQTRQAETPKPPANDPRWATCETLANETSRNSDTPTTVTFVNKSEGTRGVMWIGFDGVPKDYAQLNPGETYTINTFLTHPWMFTDGPGNCLEMYMPQLGVDTFNITAPNRDFGAE